MPRHGVKIGEGNEVHFFDPYMRRTVSTEIFWVPGWIIITSVVLTPVTVPVALVTRMVMGQ